MKDDAELYRTELVEKICELDDDLMMEYLEGEEPSVAVSYTHLHLLIWKNSLLHIVIKKMH